jgi:hypothetical protein
MTSIADSSVTIQTSARAVPSTPTWFGEVALLAHHLRQQGILAALSERVRCARRRFGHYEVIDFVAVLLGYAMSGERTLEPSMGGCTPSLRPSWRSLAATACRRARHSRAF